MIAYELINRLVRNTVDLILLSPGFTIKAKQQNAPRPKGAYADVDIISDLGLGWDQYDRKDNAQDLDITTTTQQLRQITLSVNFYRDDAVDKARKVQQALCRETIQSIFTQAKAALIRRSEVREISSTLENTWEERAQFDILLSVVGTDQEIIRSIQSVDIPAEYQTGDVNYKFNVEISE